MIKINSFKIAIFLFFLLVSSDSFAQPPDGFVRGRLVFLGVTNDSSQSVWLSVTTAGAFKLEAQGHQLIDTWNMTRRGTHLSLSPIVSQGNGGTHFLINRLNNRKLDQQNQQGGIVFPPLPSEPPSVMPPIVAFPEHPIVIPPGSPPEVTNPIPPTPEHPIVYPPGSNQPPNIPPDSNQPGNGLSSEATTQATPTKPGTTDINQKAPLTRARQFEQEKNWNIWSDNHYYTSNDGRNNLDARGWTTDFIIGADRHITTDFVFGGLVSFIKYNYVAFDGDIKNEASGLSIGPYFGYNISQEWSINGSLTYGELQNTNNIASLNSAYRTQLYHADLHAIGLYQFGHFQIRPKPLISITHFRNPAYPFIGVFNNTRFQINRTRQIFNFNFMELRLEGNYTLETKKGSIIQSYAEPGIDYAFARPNDGQMLTGNLNLASTAPVAETLTVGVRTLYKAFLIDASASYLSFGQHGLDAWELRLLASYSFG